MSRDVHVPVLLGEAVSALVEDPNGIYVDGTFGRGGHARAILARLGGLGKLWGIDQDPRAQAAGKRLASEDARFSMLNGNFEAISELLKQAEEVHQLDGVLLDIGVSSPQLDEAERGFSFMKDGPLDMRMNPEAGLSAAQWLASAEYQEIRQVLWRYGEEKASGRIANAILQARASYPIERTFQLRDIVVSVLGKGKPGKHSATRTFQAIRIHLNRELEVLERALQQATERLKPNGRLAIISFHSLEDRIVKQFFRDGFRGKQPPKDMPWIEPELGVFSKISKAIKPTQQECDVNPRARSAVLRVAYKRG